EELIGARRMLAHRNEPIVDTVSDHDAEDRATLERHGVSTVAANKAISTGIEAVKARLRKQKDGKPRLLIMRDSLVEEDGLLAELHKPLCTHDEVMMYVYPKATSGKAVKEVPVDMYNHGMDCKRYMTMHF